MCCTRLAGNTGRKKSPSAHHRTALFGCIFATKARMDNQKQLVKKQYLRHMSLQYGELQLTNGWDLLANLAHPNKFQRFSRFGSVTARHSSSVRQPHFAALNRGRHLYSAGGPSRWALAQTLVSNISAEISKSVPVFQSYSTPKMGRFWVCILRVAIAIAISPTHMMCNTFIVSVVFVKLLFLRPPYVIRQAIIFSSCGFFLLLMAALRSRGAHYVFALWFLLLVLVLLLSSFFLRLISAVGDWI